MAESRMAHFDRIRREQRAAGSSSAASVSSAAAAATPRRARKSGTPILDKALKKLGTAKNATLNRIAAKQKGLK